MITTGLPINLEFLTKITKKTEIINKNHLKNLKFKDFYIFSSKLVPEQKVYHLDKKFLSLSINSYLENTFKVA